MKSGCSRNTRRRIKIGDEPAGTSRAQRESGTGQHRLLDHILIIAAAAYLIWIGLVGIGTGGHATADLVFEGRPWLLLTS